MRSQGKSPPQNLESQVNGGNHNPELIWGISLELKQIKEVSDNFNKLQEAELESEKLLGALVLGRASQFCGIYIQEPLTILMLKS